MRRDLALRPDRRIPGPGRCSRSTRRADHSPSRESAMPDEPPLLRQWKLMSILSARRYGLTIRELAREMDVGEKTIRRNLDLFGRVGMPLEATSGERGCKTWRIAGERGQPPLTFHFEEAAALYIGRQFLEPLAGTPFWSSAHSAWRQVEAMLGETARAYIGPDERSGRAGRAGLTHMMNAVFGYRPILYRRGEMNCSEKPGQTESITIAPRGFSSARVPPKRRRDGRYRFRPDSGPAAPFAGVERRDRMDVAVDERIVGPPDRGAGRGLLRIRLGTGRGLGIHATIERSCAT